MEERLEACLSRVHATMATPKASGAEPGLLEKWSISLLTDENAGRDSKPTSRDTHQRRFLIPRINRAINERRDRTGRFQD